MRLLRTDILCWKILYRLDPRSTKYVDDHPLIETLSAVVDELVLRQGPVSNSTAKELRSQYAHNLCETLKAISFKSFKALVASQRSYNTYFRENMLLVAQAAIGDTSVVPLASLIIGRPDIKITFPPNMLQAAVAANQVDVVRKILDFFADRIPDDSEKNHGPWQVMYAIGTAMVAAVRVAVRTSRDSLGLLICDFLGEHRAVRQSVPCHWYEYPWQDCVNYGNASLFPTFLYLKQNNAPPEPTIDLRKQRLTVAEFKFIAKYSTPSLIHHIVSEGILDPNLIDGRYMSGGIIKPESPLWHALSAGAYAIAKTLIDCGADIDYKFPGPYHRESAYSRALREKMGDIQYYLLLWGADYQSDRPDLVVPENGKPDIVLYWSGSRPFKQWKPNVTRRRDDDIDNYVWD